MREEKQNAKAKDDVKRRKKEQKCGLSVKMKKFIYKRKYNTNTYK